ncbi:uncharacterized protein LOC135697123 [Ochlerotatus camptorhynchus]|uniref:uncharacterized protein LOC135697123 n=1 Tax=Ochlerotatus camptorhynchus TaxID=644619 RepID=UPI0031CECECC
MLSLEILATTVVPAMALLFVGAIGFANLFLNVRKRFPIRVNCWFCNTNTRVPYESSNSWCCQSCTQYNGFTQDGDYNREIPAQYQCRLNPRSNITDDDKISYAAPYNGLCFGCNRNQELKIHQLASFVPEVEENYDEEVNEYRRQLEQVYKLCSRCERVVKRTLNDVKRNILGSKLAQIGTKGLKVFDLHMQANEKQNTFRRRRTIADVCLGVITILLLMKLGQWVAQVDLSKKRLEAVLSPEASQIILIAISYLVAIKDTLLAQWNGIIEQPTVADGIIQLKCAKSFMFHHWSQKLDISETVSEALRESPDIMVQKHALPNLALICLAVTLLAMKLHVGNLKPLVLIACSSIELLLKTDYVQAVFSNQVQTESVEMLLVFISLVTALCCIGQTAPKIQPSDNVNSSFHKIYSQQANDVDCSDTIDDTSSILQDASICSRKEYQSEKPPGNNLSAKSMDTTKSISPSALSASTVRPFLDSSFSSQIHSPWSHMGGSVLNVNRLNATFHEQSNRSFSRSNLVLPEASLSKTPSISVDNFNTAIAGPNDSAHLGHGFSTTSLNNATLVEEDRFGNDIDRLSISGRLSVMQKDLTMVNNPFATHHVDRDDDCYLRQRKVTISPPQLGTVAESGSSWIAGGYWGNSPQKNYPDSNSEAPNGAFIHPYMSRTSSQSSGFESQPTRRPSPEESAGVDLDRVSLFSEPTGMFASNVSSVSAFQQPNPRLNQTFHLPLPQSSPVHSHVSFFSRPSNYSTSGRSLFGECNLFQSQHSSPQVPSQVFPPHHSQTPTFGGTSNLFAHGSFPSSPGGHLGGPKKAFSTVGGGGSTRRSLLNLSMLGGLAEEGKRVEE